jgi:hypothetical protein
VSDIAKAFEKLTEIDETYGDLQADKYKISDTPKAPWENHERIEADRLLGKDIADNPFAISRSAEPPWITSGDLIKPESSIREKNGPQWDENGNLKPNIEYKTGEYGYTYTTDDQGRIISVETDNLQLTKRDERLPHDKDTPGKKEGDDAGHLIGDRFGGSPEIDNLVSQLSEVNRGEYKKMENEWAEAIDRGETVQVKIEVKYDGDSKRPSEIIVKYKIGDGDWQERRFPNN